MERIRIEACCASVDDCIRAVAAGCDRIELNQALELGGLTPSAGMLQEIKSMEHVPVMVMLRPRTGGFCYTKEEFRTLCRDAELFLKLGAEGLVFGFLTDDGFVDRHRIKTLVGIAAEHESVFSRAIDVCDDWRSALETCIDLGVTRVLTSGQMPTALEGAETIRAMREFAQGKIEILPAGSIRLENVQELIGWTGCTQIHFARHEWIRDGSMQNGNIRFNGAASEDQYRVLDAVYYRQMKERLRAMVQE